MNPLQTIGDVTTRTLRLARSLPPVRAYKSLPPTLRNFINPISNARPTGGPIKSLVKGGLAGIAGDFLLSEIADRILSPEDKQKLDEALIVTQLAPGNPLGKVLAYGVFQPKALGEGEDEKMAQIHKEYYDKKKTQTQRIQQEKESTQGARRDPAETTGGAVPLAVVPYTEQGTAEVAADIAPVPQPSWVDQYQAPEGISLADFYAAQAQRGRELGAEEMLTRIREANPDYSMSDADFKTWAAANPALAYREVLKREGLVR